MTSPFRAEIEAHLQRAQESLQAARELHHSGYNDFATSRAYYAAFYAASAALLYEGVELSKHSGVIAALHQRLVKTGRLSKEHGKALNWLFELRAIGDYGVTAHISQETAALAIQVADEFVEAVIAIMTSGP
ncbi:MAG: HEPN domain-containing protein [Anaerolineae bacterium]|nr:HEPN domain-containing protein [Anaerolineae bacterium]